MATTTVANCFCNAPDPRRALTRTAPAAHTGWWTGAGLLEDGRDDGGEDRAIDVAVDRVGVELGGGGGTDALLIGGEDDASLVALVLALLLATEVVAAVVGGLAVGGLDVVEIDVASLDAVDDVPPEVQAPSDATNATGRRTSLGQRDGTAGSYGRAV